MNIIISEDKLKEMREEIKFIQDAEEQIYGKVSWSFSRKCLDVIDKYLGEKEDGNNT